AAVRGRTPGRVAGRPRRRPADALHPEPADPDRPRVAVQPGDPRHRPLGSVEVHGSGEAGDHRAVRGLAVSAARAGAAGASPAGRPATPPMPTPGPPTP